MNYDTRDSETFIDGKTMTKWTQYMLLSTNISGPLQILGLLRVHL